MAAITMPLATLRDAVNPANFVTAADNAGHRPLKIAATAFKLHLIKGDSEPARANLFGIAAMLKIDIAEAEMIGLVADRPSTGANSAALELPIGSPI